MLFAIIAFLGFSSSASAAGDQLDQGYHALYSLDFTAAHAAFHEWEKNQPDDPIGPASDAAAYLFYEFDRLKILRSEFFANDHNFVNSHKLAADPAIKAAFEKALAKSEALTAQMTIAGKTPDRALFATVICHALHADYHALIDKENLQALSEVKEATRIAETLIVKYPAYKDAYLAAGVENYLLSQKVGAVRWVLRLTGAQTDKEAGLKKLRIVADQGHYWKPYAKILLAAAAVRDNNRALARNLISELAAQFPRNDLFREEVKKLSCSSDC